jgi:hypothetical protein
LSNPSRSATRVEPDNPFAALLLKRNEPANFRHPVLIDLPDGPKQRFRGGHRGETRGRMFDSAGRPSYLPLGGETEVHPQRHVDHNDVGRARQPSRYRVKPSEPVDDPRLPGDQARMFGVVDFNRRQLPTGLPQQAVDLHVSAVRCRA